VISAFKAAHIDPNLRDDNLDGLMRDTQDRIQQGDRFFKRAAIFLNLLVETFYGFIQAINLAQQFGQDKPMVGFDLSF
jgi:hypothetical protein